ncbi:MAG: hypothetical protein M1827_000234 [Pycnora praestabilis]|nr:MAG: hypothetical protein M1827_000234 [Pycnora praestabilis]
MSPRIPSPSLLRFLAQGGSQKLFYCPSCLTWRQSFLPKVSNRHRAITQSRLPARCRTASSLASATAINAPQELPPNVRDVFQALNGVKSSAANYVNLSRLQLALRSLEARDAVIRVAVLGLNAQEGARRLVEVLIADPLVPEGTWEKQLESLGNDDGRALLIRYGETPGRVPQNALLSTLSVPSNLLQTHNLEILISTLRTSVTQNQNPSKVSRPEDAILIPSVEIPVSSTGRSSMITYPVHRSIVFGNGISSAVAYGRYTANHSANDLSQKMLKVALDLPAPEAAPPESAHSQVTTVNIQLAASSLSSFRESTENAMNYEHGWFRSGMPALLDWLTQGSKTLEGNIKPAVRNLIESLLDDTTEQISIDDARRLQVMVMSSVKEQTRHSLNDSLNIWAEHAHTELRDQLDIAFASKGWRRIRWWKLLWRVDDVDMIASELLQRRWLVEAEKEIIWVVGRIQEVFNEVNTPIAGSTLKLEDIEQPPAEPTLGSAPLAPRLSDLIPKSASDDGQLPLPPFRPWPMHISIARLQLSAATVPPLQALAQTLVLQTLSTISLTSALSALIYVSISTTSMYEAGAIATFGLVWSMRRLQKKWESARESWEGDVREEGRRALKETEGEVSRVISETGRAKADVQGAEERKEARAVVERAREALNKTP